MYVSLNILKRKEQKVPLSLNTTLSRPCSTLCEYEKENEKPPCGDPLYSLPLRLEDLYTFVGVYT